MSSRARAALALALSGVVAFCTGQPTQSPTPKPSSPPLTSLRLLEAEDVHTLDPALINDPMSLAVGSELFEGLTRLDSGNRPIPALAERWEVADGGRTYTFHLRGARYRSGAEVQAQDAVTAWARALAPGTASPLTGFFKPLGARYAGDQLASVEVVDSRTLRLHLPRPDSELLTLLAFPPYWLYDPQSVKANFGNEPDATGSGPYQLTDWERGRRLSLQTFDGYWGSRPEVRTVEIDIVPDSAARLERFRSGSIDIVHGLTGPQALAWVRDPQHAATLQRVPTSRVVWLGFNTAAGGTYGSAERRVLAQAIDRDRLTDLALYGSMLGLPATDLIPPPVPGHIDRKLPAHDPTAVKRGLDETKVPRQIDLYFSSGPTTGRVARELQDELQDATGRTVVLHPAGDFVIRAAFDQFPVLLDSWTADVPHPADILENVLRGRGQFNNLHLQEPGVDTALDQARAALTLDDALKAYRRAVEFVLSETYLIPLYYGTDPYLVRAGLHVPFSGAPIPYRWQEVRVS